MLNENNIGILTCVPDLWGDIWSSRHHVMSRLSRYYKVLWVSPPLPWRQVPSIGFSNMNTRGINRVSSNLWAYAPEWYLPCKTRFKFVLHCWDWARRRKIKRFLSEMGIKRLILYLWRPEYGSYVGKFDEELVCYHIDDEYTFSFDKDLPVSKTEGDLIERSDVVFIHSKSLLKKKGHLNPETHYMPNGVDFERFREILSDAAVNLHELDEIPRPRIGYVGYIKDQIDLDLIHHIAKEKKNWSIVLIGPASLNHMEVKRKIELLRKEKNVFILGAKKPDELPICINKLDVCLMCYRKNEYTKHIYPLKVNEYLACGKPVVSTYLENLKDFEPLIYFAGDADDWIKKIHRCLDENDSAKNARRIAVSEQNSWDRRVELITALFQGKMPSVR